MSHLFFLDPTPKALCAFPEAARRGVYEKIGAIVHAKRAIPRAGRVSISRVSLDHASIEVVYGRMADNLVILAIGTSASSTDVHHFESMMETLKHMDLSSLGLVVSQLPGTAEQGVRVLDGAINLYCQMHVKSRNHYVHDQNAGVNRFIHRLVGTTVKRWASSEARTNFKDVLDRAERDPQVIERGERRFVLVDESQLETLAGQKNAAQMYKHFFEDLEPMEPFERIPGRPPGRLLDLS